jgi:hypothetical protein
MWGHLYLSSTNGTTLTTAVFPCATGTYVTRLRAGTLPPSDAKMPLESASAPLSSVGGVTMADNLDILNTAISPLIRAVLLAARFSGRLRQRYLGRLASGDIDAKATETLSLRRWTYHPPSRDWTSPTSLCPLQTTSYVIEGGGAPGRDGVLPRP